MQRLCFKIAFGNGGAYFKALGKRFWCLKTFPNKKSAACIEKLFSNAKFIHIVRDGLDVVHSMTRFSGFKDRKFEEQCRDWADSIESFHYLTQMPSAIAVRHEALVSEPDMFFKDIFRHIGLPYSGKSAAFSRSTLIHPLDQAGRNNINVKDALSGRKRGYEDWPVEWRQAFKDICGEAMEKTGYEIPF